MTDMKEVGAVIEKESVEMITTRRIDNYYPFVEVIPKKVKKKNSLHIPAFVNEYEGEIGLVVSKNSNYTGELVCFDKHTKKKLRLLGSMRYFVPELEILCAVDLSDDLETTDYMTDDLLEHYSRQSEGAKVVDLRHKTMIGV